VYKQDRTKRSSYTPFSVTLFFYKLWQNSKITTTQLNMKLPMICIKLNAKYKKTTIWIFEVAQKKHILKKVDF